MKKRIAKLQRHIAAKDHVPDRQRHDGAGNDQPDTLDVSQNVAPNVILPTEASSPAAEQAADEATAPLSDGKEFFVSWLAGNPSHESDDGGVSEKSSPDDLGCMDHFQIVRKLGQGGFGSVYLAHDTKLDRMVAVKVLDGLDDAAAREMIQEETRAAARLAAHPNIVSVFQAGIFNKRRYIVFEYIPGRDLDKASTLRDTCLAAGGRLPATTAVRYVKQVAEALAHAHENGVFHRDIKPQNVLIDFKDTAYVADFGCARRPQTSASKNTIVGTIPYMSPEQLKGSSNAQTDIWSVGVLLFEVLAGERPFQVAEKKASARGASSRQKAKHFATALGACAHPPSLLDTAPDLDIDLDAICAACLQRKPSERYASARELAVDLGRWERNEPPSCRDVGFIERTRRWAERNPVIATQLAAIAVLLVGGLIMLAYQNTLLRSSQRKFVEAQVSQLLDENAAEDLAKFDTILKTLETDPFPPYAVRRLTAEWKKRSATADDSSKAAGLSAAIVGFASLEESFDDRLATAARSRLWESLLTANSPQDFDLADHYLVHATGKNAWLWKVAAERDKTRSFRALMSLAIRDPGSKHWEAKIFDRLATLLIDQNESDLSAWARKIPPDVAAGIKPFVEEKQEVAQGEYRRRFAMVLVALPTSSEDLIHEIPQADLDELAESLAELARRPEGEISPLEALATSADLDANGRANVSIALLYLRSPREIECLPIFHEQESRNNLDEAGLQQSMEARLLFESYARDSGLACSTLRDWLRQIPDERSDQKQTAIQAMGRYDIDTSAASRPQVVDDMEQLFLTEPDSGVHASAEWLLRKWRQPLPAIAKSQQPSRNGFHWYVNERGQTYVRIDGDEKDFWVSTTEITIGEYAEYLEDRENEDPPTGAAVRKKRELPIAQFYREFFPNYYKEHQNTKSWTQCIRDEDKRLPINSLTSLHAIVYCTWASMREELELCYGTDKQSNVKQLEAMEADLKRMRQMPNCDRTKDGYRLPTFDEWTLVLEAGTLQSIDQEPAANDLGWHSRNSADTLWAVGSKRPNRLGVFDLLGNVSEFCQGVSPDGVQVGEIRGCSYKTPPRKPNFNRNLYLSGDPSYGFRIVRTEK